MDQERGMGIGDTESLLDCIVIGAGPGGLQACIHLGRYNFRVILFHRPGGRTWHAKRIENYLSHRIISGPDLLETGLAQAESFGVTVEQAKVERVSVRERHFEVQAAGKMYRTRFVIAASGARESLAPFKNLPRFFGKSYFTCMICDGYRTTGKKLLLIDRTINGVRLSIGMKQVFTSDVTFLAHGFSLTPQYASLLEEEGIGYCEGRPEELIGEEILEGVRLADGLTIPCEVIMGWGGISLNDDYLEGLSLERDAEGFKILTSSTGESSIPGLFVLGALRQGHSQAIISAGQGAEAAIEISTRIVEL
ncbi:MAG: NAD(P)/FAD-dependent oxidoreductase [Nitrospiraceae bacterium]|nr:MAG: NAD(P)/FAD-dependent oxidoreductase [Nitrospiraceae bacterium]